MVILAVGALISFLGVPAGILGNELSIRYGLRNVATLVFLLSAVAGGLFGFTAMKGRISRSTAAIRSRSIDLCVCGTTEEACIAA